MGKMAFRMRSSKFRHVYGSPAKKENCYECIKITKNAHDSNFCAANPKFVAIVTESAGGGAFLVLPLEKTGRVDINASKICGHSGPVLDVKWNPFNDNIIASCSDDATVKLWQIPEGGLSANLTEWLVDLHGHQRRVGHIAWHPTAQSILLSAGFDHKCILWNTDTAEPINIINVHTDTIFSIAWNYDGSMFATTSKDKRIRIIDPREGDIIQEGPGHAGSKASKVVFLGETNRLLTTGFSRLSDRQYAVWEFKNLGRPLVMENIDSSSGVLFPYYDHDTNVVFIAGKGDGNIRYYELVNDPPYCHFLDQYQSSSPQRGLGVMPKRGIDPSRCEIVRFYKLHAVKGICEPISMIVPRKSEMFQEDIFPPTASACPSLNADEWISGQDRQPILISLKDGNMISSPKAALAVKRQTGSPYHSTRNLCTMSFSNDIIDPHYPVSDNPLPDDSRPSSSRQQSAIPTSTSSKLAKSRITQTAARFTKKDIKKEPKRESLKREMAGPTTTASTGAATYSSKKDGALSSSPVITTYKAVKRGVGAVTTTTPERGMKRQSTAPPTATVAPSQGRLPASLQNIRKMTSLEDAENQNDENDNTERINTVNDRITSFEKKTTVNVTKSLMRMTNNNQPLRVERKIWSTNYTGVNANAKSPTSNGMPRTDPEQNPPFETQESPEPSDISRDQDSSYHDNQDRNSSNALQQAEDELYANLQIENPHPKQRVERKWSRISDSGSEPFTTPPTSPNCSTSPDKITTPIRSETSLSNCNTSILESPATWRHNPLYKDTEHSTEKRKSSKQSNGEQRQSKSPVKDVEMVTEIDDGIIRDSFYRRSLRSSNRSKRSESDPRFGSNSRVLETSPLQNDKDVIEENNNKLPAGMDVEESNFIDLEGCFPSDAPDHTLIKPSKLRASLRGRRRLTNGSTSSMDNEETPNEKRKWSTSPDSENGPQHSRRHRRNTDEQNEQRLQHQENGQSHPSRHFFPSRNVIIVENKSRSRSSIASCTAREKISYPSPPVIPYGMISPEPRSPVSNDQTSVTDHLNANTPEAPVKPSRVKDSFRKQPRHHRSLDNSNSIHVKKVWTTSPESSPVSPPPDFGMIPTTDAELRKAYFRQVEEISSLKEQIGLKDKRIRQLEEEVRVLRDGRELMGESTC